jgi:hypothetical protein
MTSAHSIADSANIDALANVPDLKNPPSSITINRESSLSGESESGTALPATRSDMETLRNAESTGTAIIPQLSRKSRHASSSGSGSNNLGSHPNKSIKSSSTTLKRRRSVVSISSNDDTNVTILSKKTLLPPNAQTSAIDLDDATLAHRLWAYLSKQEAALDDGRRLWLNKYNILKQHEDDLQARQKNLNDRVQALEKATARLDKIEVGVQRKEAVIREREKKLDELGDEIEESRRQLQLRKQNVSDWMRSEEIIWQKAFGKGEDKHRHIEQNLSSLMNSIMDADFYSYAQKPYESGPTQGLKPSTSKPPSPQIFKAGKPKVGKTPDVVAKQDIEDLTLAQVEALEKEMFGMKDPDSGSEVLPTMSDDYKGVSMSKGKGKEKEDVS